MTVHIGRRGPGHVARLLPGEAPPAPPADTTPDAFTFAAVTGAAVSTLYESDEVEVRGIDAPAAISVVGGEYSINGGAWTSAPGLVLLGDRVKVRGGSSGASSTAVDVVLTIGGVSGTFTITTAGAVAPLPGATAYDPTTDAVVLAAIGAAGLGASWPADWVLENWHPTSAAITPMARADGRPGFSALKDTTGAKTLEPGTADASFPNASPEIVALDVYDQDNPSLHLGQWKVLRFAGGQRAAYKAGTTSNARFAYFTVMSLADPGASQRGFVQSGYANADGGSIGATTPTFGNMAYMFNQTTVTSDVQRSPAVSGRTITTGAGDSVSCHLSEIMIPESMCAFSAMMRTANDTSIVAESQRSRVGVNNRSRSWGAGGPTSTTTGTGYTLGCTLTNAGEPTQHMVGDFMQIAMVRWAVTDMPFSVAEVIRTQMQAHWGVRNMTRRVYLTGDSRAAQGSLTGVKMHARLGRQMAWPYGRVPSNIQVMQWGAGGQWIEQLLKWLPAGSSPHKLFSSFLHPTLPTDILFEFFHNDMGTNANAFYSPTPTSSTARVDAYLAASAQAAQGLADLVKARGGIIMPIAPAASAISPASLFDYARNTAALAFSTPAFVAQAQGGDATRKVRPIDLSTIFHVGLPLVNKTTKAPAGVDAVGMKVWDQPVGSNDYRNSGTTGTNHYWIPGCGEGEIFEGVPPNDDLTHHDEGGSKLKGNDLGDLYLAALA